MRPAQRQGHGLDFHRLSVDPGRPLILGGTTIPSDLALLGHSDADVILHALSDALLGALARGDIGDLFPDTEERYKNMDSQLILKAALDLMQKDGYHLANVDLTVMGEVPRIKPHRLAIRERLSELLGLPLSSISLKATTTETMGALGRKEGVGCMASVLLLDAGP
ncbi:MAG: 2-C-methyl-D-erythritol 2,4-cyclodiphosphate synthase [Spirochaetales bacterium]|nr:2-C-methyl-D-erythritol 2,4-cyclodiphosphate synthase [Spirochaetales bacterium]